MARRRIRPWLPFLALAAVVAVLAVVQFWRRATTPDAPPSPPTNGQVPTSMRTESLEMQLRARGLHVTAVACADRPDATYLFAGAPDPALVEGLPAELEYADCWRAVVLFDPHGGGSLLDQNPYEFRLSSFRVFGDPTLVEAFRNPDPAVTRSPDHPHAGSGVMPE